jgi:hypothetical protein
MSTKKGIVATIVLLLCIQHLHAQYTDGMTGLLHAPSAEMQRDGTVLIGGGFLNRELTPSNWNYNTYNYYINVTFFSYFEIGYICTLSKGTKRGALPVAWREQDRHFAFRIRVLKEGQFWKHMPAVVLGASDPFTTFQKDVMPGATGNGHFNKYYIAATKHFNIQGGVLGMHLSYLYNVRKYDKLNGIGAGITYDLAAVKGLRLLAEYDSKDFYLGAHYDVFRYLKLQAMLENGQYFSGGLTFVLPLLRQKTYEGKR